MVWEQYLNNSSASKTFILIKYGTFSTRDKNKILDSDGKKGFNRARRLRLAEISHFEREPSREWRGRLALLGRAVK